MKFLQISQIIVAVLLIISILLQNRGGGVSESNPYFSETPELLSSLSNKRIGLYGAAILDFPEVRVMMEVPWSAQIIASHMILLRVLPIRVVSLQLPGVLLIR